MELIEEMEKLEKVRKDNTNKVFTMYLNTDPSDPEQQGGEWKIHFKNGLQNFEHYLEEDENKEELKNFQQIRQKVERFVRGNEQNFRKGIILFATADEEVWFAERVQMRLKTEFFWGSIPVLDQFNRLYQSFPKSGLILVQQDQVKVIEAEIGEITDTAYYELDIETDHWRQFTGPHKADASMGKGGKSLKQEDFQDRYEANKQRWYKSIAPKLDKRAKDNGWEEIYIVGGSDASWEIKAQMNKSVDQVIQKNLLEQEESKVLEDVFG
ncbi:VLRF1 family aeRF1-type release factor [Lentibacillus sp. Marseille-P4043]|uniref:VLRF1 family aeRF1-type release factor n=1 Tax=Lentibacillus sp. Marseille-P4043 TaxID=2040293 RepID=UPI000D0AF82A|nr:VLRF1 family aeRF1-type release factor [Lentibacillus sp. Marseille-P4043]